VINFWSVRFDLPVAAWARTMLLMNWAATTLRGLCVLAVIATACGCRKTAAPPEAPQRAERPTAATRPSQPVAKDAPSHFWRRRRALAKRRIKELTDPERWLRLARTGLRAAAEACDKSLADPTTHMRAGDKALANGQTELSIDCFSRGIALAPKNADAHRGLAVATFALAAEQTSTIEARKLYRRAAEVYRAILALDANDETARFNLGLALLRSGSPTQADEALRPLLSSREFRTKATFNISVILVSHGKLDQAEALLQRLIRKNRDMGDSDLAAAHSHLGEVLVDLNDTKGALEAYKEAARLMPKDVGVWLNLATAARAHGSYGYAVTATRKAAELSPFNAEIHLRLGNLLLELHRATREERFLTEAVDAWRASLKVAPSQASLQRRVDIYSRKAPTTQPTSTPASRQ
jgi:tetratricopeptide (TPR) repeat protein